jgi:hypothetical protein
MNPNVQMKDLTALPACGRTRDAEIAEETSFSFSAERAENEKHSHRGKTNNILAFSATRR